VASFVLIPGAGGSAFYWHLVVPRLQAHGHDVVAVELPAADDSAGLEAYTTTVVEAAGDRSNLVIVAQSLGGFTAPLVCQQLPVALLVLVNAMIPAPGETPGAWWANTQQREARRLQNVRDGRPADAPFDLLVDFFHDVPQAVIDAAWAQGEPKQSDAIFASPCAFTRWPDVPTRVLVGRDDRLFPAEFQRRVAHDRLGLAVDEMPGGHLVALSRPEELAVRLADCATAAGPDFPARP